MTIKETQQRTVEIEEEEEEEETTVSGWTLTGGDVYH